jgi:hypothetical protein
MTTKDEIEKFLGFDREYAQELFDDLEAAGIIEKTGQMRPGRDGKMQPVYVIADKYRNDPKAADRVLKAMYDDEPPTDTPQ